MKISDLIVLKCAKQLKTYCKTHKCCKCIFNKEKLDGKTYYCEFDCLLPEDWNIE